MSASQLGYTQGSGSQIKTDQGSTTGDHIQVVKLAEGTSGSENLLTATVANGVLVQISGALAALQASAPIASPVSVRISNGIANVDTIPVAGTVTGGQGAPNTNANAWPVKLTDGTNNPHLTQVGANYSQDVNLTQAVTLATQITNGTNNLHLTSVSGSYAADVNIANVSGSLPGIQADKTNFVEGSGLMSVMGGVVDDTPVSNPGQNQASSVRITPLRAVHANLRNASGAEIGLSASPIYVQPNGSGTQPVSGTVVAQVTGPGGVNFSTTNPMSVAPAPPATNFWRQTVTFSASQTAVAVHTPVSGKTAYVMGFIITPTAAGAQFILFDNSDSATTELYNGQPPLSSVVVTFPTPVPLSAVNNILRYSTGASAAGTCVAWGYDA